MIIKQNRNNVMLNLRRTLYNKMFFISVLYLHCDSSVECYKTAQIRFFFDWPRKSSLYLFQAIFTAIVRICYFMLLYRGFVLYWKLIPLITLYILYCNYNQLDFWYRCYADTEICHYNFIQNSIYLYLCRRPWQILMLSFLIIQS